MRSTHQFEKSSCNLMSCCRQQNSYETREFVDTTVNIIKNKVRSSCFFSTFDLDPFYDAGGNPDTAFVTNPSHPSAVTIPPGELSKGAVFLITSFTTTDQTGTTTSHVDETNQFNVSISRPGLLPVLPNVISDDTPKEALAGNYIFGSFDTVLQEIFKKYRRPKSDNSNLYNKGNVFLSLTNPNELELGTSNVVQILWPDHLDWEFSFVANNNKKYTYSSKSCLGANCGSVTETDLATPDVTTTLATFQSSGSWAVPCNPIGYVTQRQTFDFTFPGPSGPTGCSGATDGLMCIESIVVENYNVTIPTNCLCAPFTDDTGITGVAGPTGNHIILTTLLNKAFDSNNYLKGWLAIPDIEYGYFRIVYPDNILFFTITVTKMFQNNGTYVPQCAETQIYRQGALTEFIKPDGGMNQVTTTNNMCIMDGLCWTIETDMNGCFLI